MCSVIASADGCWVFTLALVGLFALGRLWDALFHGWGRCPHGRWSGNQCTECAKEKEERRHCEEEFRRHAEMEAQARRRREDDVVADLARRAGDWVRQQQSIDRMDPFKFEALVLEMYRRLGWTVRDTPRSNDGGVDGYLTRERYTLVLQCKRQKGNVGEPVVRDLYGSCMHESAAGAVVVTTGGFTESAKAWAKGKPITLVDRSKLMEMVREAFAHDAPPGFSRGGSPDDVGSGVRCPSCDQPIHLREYSSGLAAECSGCSWRHWMPTKTEVQGRRWKRKRRRYR